MRGFIYKITNKTVDKQTIKELLVRNNIELRTTKTYKCGILVRVI